MKNYYEAPTMKLIVLEEENDVITTSGGGMDWGESTESGGTTEWDIP